MIEDLTVKLRLFLSVSVQPESLARIEVDQDYIATAKNLILQAANELGSIDALIARRPAMDKATRYENIAHAIKTAGEKTDEAARLESSLREVRERKDQRIVELVQELSRWKDEITDMAIVDWSFSKQNENDPKQMVTDMIVNAVKQALDPAISEDAQKLIDQGIRVNQRVCDCEIYQTCEICRVP